MRLNENVVLFIYFPWAIGFVGLKKAGVLSDVFCSVLCILNILHVVELFYWLISVKYARLILTVNQK
jgi:hypothetical protein